MRLKKSYLFCFFIIHWLLQGSAEKQFSLSDSTHKLINVRIFRSLPAACLAAKCVLDNENGIDRNQPFHGVVESFGESTKCHHRNLTSIYQLNTGLAPAYLPQIEMMGGDNGLALRRLGSLFYYYCDNEGCSISRRWNAMINEIAFWSGHIDQELIWRIKEKTWDWGNSWLFYGQAYNLNGRVIAPIFIFSHVISARVLTNMLVNDNTSILFHMSELITDMIGCMWTTLFNLCMHVSFAYCTKINSSDPMHSDFGLFDGLYFLDFYQPWEILFSVMPATQLGNQLFNVLLVFSRCFALKYPMKYRRFNVKKHASKVVIGGFVLLFFLAIWPSKPRDTRFQLLLADIGEWEWAWRIWPMFRGSRAIQFMMEIKSNVFLILLGVCFFGQIGLSAYLTVGYQQWLRKQVVENETQQQAKDRKFKEQQKVYLMMCTVGVNLLSMIPTILVQFSDPLGLGFRNTALAGYLIGAQFIASGFNSAGGLLANLAFTESYRTAFKDAWIKPIKDLCCKSNNVQSMHGGND